MFPVYFRTYVPGLYPGGLCPRAPELLRDCQRLIAQQRDWFIDALVSKHRRSPPSKPQTIVHPRRRD